MPLLTFAQIYLKAKKHFPPKSKKNPKPDYPKAILCGTIQDPPFELWLPMELKNGHPLINKDTEDEEREREEITRRFSDCDVYWVVEERDFILLTSDDYGYYANRPNSWSLPAKAVIEPSEEIRDLLE